MSAQEVSFQALCYCYCYAMKEGPEQDELLGWPFYAELHPPTTAMLSIVKSGINSPWAQYSFPMVISS